MNASKLRMRIRICLAFLITGLVLSGLSAFPLRAELPIVVRMLKALMGDSGLATWLASVSAALQDTDRKYLFLAYGTDWLGFAHLVIAISFIGAWRDPVRNKWLFTFGLIACTAVIPFALIAGGFREVPLAWRLVDCSFGIMGAIPLIICIRTVEELERMGANAS